MSHAFQMSDTAYEALRAAAAARDQSVEDLFAAWLNSLPEPQSATPQPLSSEGDQQRQESDPLAPFLGAFEATVPDLIRRHDHYLAEAAAQGHHTGQ